MPPVFVAFRLARRERRVAKRLRRVAAGRSLKMNNGVVSTQASKRVAVSLDPRRQTRARMTLGGECMSEGYVLGQSERAARRLAIQDILFAEASERLLDDLSLRAHDRVVELGCGPGGFSRRILQRLGQDGVLVGV